VRFKGDVNKAKSVYDNIVPCTAEDVADQIIYVSTRPKHVQVADIVTYATNQPHAKYEIARVGKDLGAK